MMNGMILNKLKIIIQSIKIKYEKWILKIIPDEWFVQKENQKDNYLIRILNFICLCAAIYICINFENGIEFNLFNLIENHLPKFEYSIFVWTVITGFTLFYFGYRAFLGYPATNTFGGLLPSIMMCVTFIYVVIVFYGIIIYLLFNVGNLIFNFGNQFIEVLQVEYYIISFFIGIIGFILKIIVWLLFVVLSFLIAWIATMILGVPTLAPLFIFLLCLNTFYKYMFKSNTK